ncbi:MAG TPA: hypothetical protein VMD48_15765 [Solirubrobacteraceae bacterium]|nr:hypothetical protein [Solirubrobacteraceae bacterium]
MRITERDRVVLAFAGEQKLVLADQVKALLGTSLEAAARRLRALRAEGFLDADRPFAEQPACHQVTREGLALIESRLPTPRAVDRAHYRHDVGVGWLWLAARAGVWGELSDVVSERAMRSRDGRAPGAERYGVRLGGLGPGGRERFHYPDLLLVDPNGHRVAVELELSGKGHRRLEGILGGYAADPRIDAALYLVDKPSVGRNVQAAARALGISDLVHVQRAQWGENAPAAGTARVRARRQVRAASKGGVLER